MTGIIFINYRRGDESGFAGRLFDRLETQFPAERLFMDVDSIPPGMNFVELLDDQVTQCDIFLAVIGKDWLRITDDSGKRRIDEPNDFVRIEIESALRQNKRVIPVLINDARMPSEQDLPESLKPLASRNAVRLTHERFRSDSKGLISALQRALKAEQKIRDAQKKRKHDEYWNVARESQDASTLKAFASDWPESPHIKEVRKKIRNLQINEGEQTPVLVWVWFGGVLIGTLALGSVFNVSFRSWYGTDEGFELGWVIGGVISVISALVIGLARRRSAGSGEVAVYWMGAAITGIFATTTAIKFFQFHLVFLIMVLGVVSLSALLLPVFHRGFTQRIARTQYLIGGTGALILGLLLASSEVSGRGLGELLYLTGHAISISISMIVGIIWGSRRRFAENATIPWSSYLAAGIIAAVGFCIVNGARYLIDPAAVLSSISGRTPEALNWGLFQFLGEILPWSLGPLFLTVGICRLARVQYWQWVQHSAVLERISDGLILGMIYVFGTLSALLVHYFVGTSFGTRVAKIITHGDLTVLVFMPVQNIVIGFIVGVLVVRSTRQWAHLPATGPNLKIK